MARWAGRTRLARAIVSAKAISATATALAPAMLPSNMSRALRVLNEKPRSAPTIERWVTPEWSTCTSFTLGACSIICSGMYPPTMAWASGATASRSWIW